MNVIGAVAISAGALVMVAGTVGCSAPPPALGAHTAEVSINGRDTGSTHPVSCSQFGWDWKVETLQETPGFVATFETGDDPQPKSVQIRDLGGFTGTYWKYTTGDANFRVDDGGFVLTGTAVGFTAERPTKTASATFAIATAC